MKKLFNIFISFVLTMMLLCSISTSAFASDKTNVSIRVSDRTLTITEGEAYPGAERILFFDLDKTDFYFANIIDGFYQYEEVTYYDSENNELSFDEKYGPAQPGEYTASVNIEPIINELKNSELAEQYNFDWSGLKNKYIYEIKFTVKSVDNDELLYFNVGNLSGLSMEEGNYFPTVRNILNVSSDYYYADKLLTPYYKYAEITYYDINGDIVSDEVLNQPATPYEYKIVIDLEEMVNQVMASDLVNYYDFSWPEDTYYDDEDNEITEYVAYCDLYVNPLDPESYDWEVQYNLYIGFTSKMTSIVEDENSTEKCPDVADLLNCYGLMLGDDEPVYLTDEYIQIEVKDSDGNVITGDALNSLKPDTYTITWINIEDCVNKLQNEWVLRNKYQLIAVSDEFTCQYSIVYPKEGDIPVYVELNDITIDYCYLPSAYEYMTLTGIEAGDELPFSYVYDIEYEITDAEGNSYDPYDALEPGIYTVKLNTQEADNSLKDDTFSWKYYLVYPEDMTYTLTIASHPIINVMVSDLDVTINEGAAYPNAERAISFDPASGFDFEFYLAIASYYELGNATYFDSNNNKLSEDEACGPAKPGKYTASIDIQPIIDAINDSELVNEYSFDLSGLNGETVFNYSFTVEPLDEDAEKSYLSINGYSSVDINEGDEYPDASYILSIDTDSYGAEKLLTPYLKYAEITYYDIDENIVSEDVLSQPAKPYQYEVVVNLEKVKEMVEASDLVKYYDIEWPEEYYWDENDNEYTKCELTCIVFVEPNDPENYNWEHKYNLYIEMPDEFSQMVYDENDTLELPSVDNFISYSGTVGANEYEIIYLTDEYIQLEVKDSEGNIISGDDLNYLKPGSYTVTWVNADECINKLQTEWTYRNKYELVLRDEYTCRYNINLPTIGENKVYASLADITINEGESFPDAEDIIILTGLLDGDEGPENLYFFSDFTITDDNGEQYSKWDILPVGTYTVEWDIEDIKFWVFNDETFCSKYELIYPENPTFTLTIQEYPSGSIFSSPKIYIVIGAVAAICAAIAIIFISKKKAAKTEAI